MDIFYGSIVAFMSWLGSHQQGAYLILFFGAYLETLIGPSFFIPGEIFLLSGSILGGIHVLNIGYVALALYSGAILGDNSSYFIGYHASRSIFKEERKIFSLKNYDKGAAFFTKYGNKAIFFARILGPLSWITPFLAGIYRVPYRTFFLYNTPGIFIGIGEFLVIGYFFGNQYQRIFSLVGYYFTGVIVLIIIFLIFHWYRRYRYRFKENSVEDASIFPEE